MYNKKVYNSTVYYVNCEPQLRATKRDGSLNQFVNITSIYGKALVITPAKKICNKYDVCMQVDHAKNWLDKQGIKDIVIPTNFNGAIVLPWKMEYGNALATTWEKYFGGNIRKGFLTEISSSLTKDLKQKIDDEMKPFGLTYSMFLRG